MRMTREIKTNGSAGYKVTRVIRRRISKSHFLQSAVSSLPPVCRWFPVLRVLLKPEVRCCVSAVGPGQYLRSRVRCHPSNEHVNAVQVKPQLLVWPHGLIKGLLNLWVGWGGGARMGVLGAAGVVLTPAHLLDTSASAHLYQHVLVHPVCCR